MSLSKRLINTKPAGGVGNFNTVLYTGDGTDNRQITGVGFQPDWVWFKSRTVATNNILYDSVRGTSSYTTTNAGAQFNSTQFTSYDSDGFTLGPIAGSFINRVGEDYVAWCWKAGGTSVTNTDGTITSQVSANTEAGFSIVQYAGTANGTVGHGLGVEPDFIFARSTNVTNGTATYHSALGSNYNTRIDSALGSANITNFWGASGVTNSSVFGLENDPYGFNVYGTLIAYCFTEIPGFSKFGTYTGNGNGSLDPSGTVVAQTITTGFEPAMVILRTTQSGYWGIFDNKRGGSSPGSQWRWLWPSRTKIESDASGAGGYSTLVDFTPTGFTLGNDASGDWNTNGQQFIYLAFANEF
jgi:hypothetical protein